MKRTKRNRVGIFAVVGLIVMMLVVAGFAFVSSKQSPESIPARDAVALASPPPVAEETLVKKKTFGLSERGRTIRGYEIGAGEECLLLFGGIHGNEKGTVELLQKFIDVVTADPKLLSPSKKLVVLPLLNPDGYSDNIYRTNANGVNLNRNFPTMTWTQFSDSETFAGAKPFSESESRALQAAVEACNPSIMVAFHSQGGVVSPEANTESLALANWYIEKSGYTFYNDWNYPGTATGWFSETTGNPAITVELTDHDANDWEINHKALLDLISE